MSPFVTAKKEVIAALQPQDMMPRAHVKRPRPVIKRTLVRNNAQKKRTQELPPESLAAQAPKSTPLENRALPCENISAKSGAGHVISGGRKRELPGLFTSRLPPQDAAG